MNLFVQGMRRSGTTILYDALLEDPELRCFYEPLREDKVTVGGGSGARDTDAFAETRELRREYARRHHPDLDPRRFNWGGPKRPQVELDPQLPDHCAGFLRELLRAAPSVAIKETRLHHKVAALAELDPTAALVNVVRDPRAVVASTMLGRDRRHLDRYPTADAFFADRSERKLWSSRPISELVIERSGRRDLGDPPDHLRVLLVWSAQTAATIRDGREHFGERFLVMRNEDLRSDPAAALDRLYATLGRPVPPPVAAWAHANVRPPEEPWLGDDPHWLESFRQAGMEAVLSDAGYGHLTDT